MTDDEVRTTLLWLVDQVEAARINTPRWLHGNVCLTCGHGLGAHVIVEHDADDVRQPWPCHWPQVIGAPVAMCMCGDWTPQPIEDE